MLGCQRRSRDVRPANLSGTPRPDGKFHEAGTRRANLQATALVHEVYLKLIDVQNVDLEGKAHFFAICAQMMRRILVDSARNRAASQHGGGQGRIHLDDLVHINLSRQEDKHLIALNDAAPGIDNAGPMPSWQQRYFYASRSSKGQLPWRWPSPPPLVFWSSVCAPKTQSQEILKNRNFLSH